MAKKFLTSIDLSKCELLNASMHNLAAAPGSPADGQIYFNTGDGQMYYYNGSAWQSMSGDITSVTLTGGAGATITQNNSNNGAYTATVDVNVDGGDAKLAHGFEVRIEHRFLVVFDQLVVLKSWIKLFQASDLVIY